jgi:hypothetical protein
MSLPYADQLKIYSPTTYCIDVSNCMDIGLQIPMNLALLRDRDAIHSSALKVARTATVPGCSQKLKTDLSLLRLRLRPEAAPRY